MVICAIDDCLGRCYNAIIQQALYKNSHRTDPFWAADKRHLCRFLQIFRNIGNIYLPKILAERRMARCFVCVDANLQGIGREHGKGYDQWQKK